MSILGLMFLVRSMEDCLDDLLQRQNLQCNLKQKSVVLLLLSLMTSTLLLGYAAGRRSPALPPMFRHC